MSECSRSLFITKIMSFTIFHLHYVNVRTKLTYCACRQIPYTHDAESWTDGQ